MGQPPCAPKRKCLHHVDGVGRPVRDAAGGSALCPTPGHQSLALQPRRTANNTLFTNREDSGADSSSYYPSASRTEADGSPDSDVFLPSSLRDGLSYLFPALRNYSAWASSSRPVSAKEEGSRRPFTDTPCSKTPAGIWLICHCSQ